MIKDLYSIFLQSSGIAIDSRRVEKGNLFFALKGENFDGNDYATKAIENGATCAVVSNHKLEGGSFFYVSDTLKALQDLAAFHRNKLNIPLFAVTGSNGKTTTKELIAHVLRAKFNVFATKGNLNNHIGVPLTLLEMTADHDIGVVEMGANHLKEIEFLCAIAKPNYGIITNIGKAHVGEFGSLENIRRGKLELFDFLEATSGKLFYNEEDVQISKDVSFYSNSISYNSVIKEDVVLQSSIPSLKFLFVGNNIDLNIGGRYNFTNCRAAIAVGVFFNVEKEKISNQLNSFSMIANRSQWIDTSKNTIFLDAYNANPDSIQKSLDYFLKVEYANQCVIIGDMLELGDFSEKEHQLVARELSGMNITHYLIGKQFSTFCKGNNVFLSVEEFIDSGNIESLHNYSILLKGSRGVALERLLEYL